MTPALTVAIRDFTQTIELIARCRMTPRHRLRGRQHDAAIVRRCSRRSELPRHAGVPFGDEADFEGDRHDDLAIATAGVATHTDSLVVADLKNDGNPTSWVVDISDGVVPAGVLVLLAR